MKIRTGAVRYRMLRRGDLKLYVYNEHPPMLHDLAADPDEVNDLAGERPRQMAALMAELTEGWDVQAIARQQALNAERTALIRDWVRATGPKQRVRWQDPQPQRNRYLT